MASKCRSCGAPLLWAQTTAGKNMPLDAAPTANGNIELRHGLARYVTPDANATTPRYTSHFATCPNAGQHRKKGSIA
jgi:hypothetical protein